MASWRDFSSICVSVLLGIHHSSCQSPTGCVKFGYHKANAMAMCTICPVGKTGHERNLRNVRLVNGSHEYDPSMTTDTWVPGCFDCGRGEFKNDSNAVMCTRCPPGKISGLHMLECDDCPAGSTTFEDFWRCDGCHQGTHAPTAGSAYCAPCPAGTMSENNFTISLRPITACIPCPVGQAAHALKLGHMCTNCHAPSFAHKTGALTCQVCNRGSVENASEATGCTMCAAGTYQSRHARHCIECSAGQYSKQAQRDGCDMCPAGTFVATPASTACTVCTPGTISEVGARWCSSICMDHTNEMPVGCLSMHVVPVIVRITRMQPLNFTLERQTELRKGVGIFFNMLYEQVQISETRAVADGMLDVRLDMTSARHHTVLIDTAMKKKIGPEFASLESDVLGFEFPPPAVRQQIVPSGGQRKLKLPSTWAWAHIGILVVWNFPL